MEPHYPEQERRKKMLWAVYEWVQGRQDLRQNLTYDEVANLVDDPVYPTAEDPNYDYQVLSKHMDDQLALFQTLVREGYIDADLKGRSKTGPPFSFAIVRGLHDKGHQLIGSLPNPQDALLARLDAIEQAIGKLGDISTEEQKKGIDAVEELKGFVRALPPGVALQLLGNFFQ